MPTKEAWKIQPLLGDKPGSFRVLLAATSSSGMEELRRRLVERGFQCSLATGEHEELIQQVGEQDPDIVLLAADKSLYDLSRRIKQEKPLPVIGLLNKYASNDLALDPNLDDFIMEPYHTGELELRIRRLLMTKDTGDNRVIRVGDLVIDLAKCEVSVNGSVVTLTFREYELLKFLVSNRGRVFSREALLDKVWGYDYFGGDRTVDVHIRRLRGKIEGPKHTFIETIRSIGYRFKAGV